MAGAFQNDSFQNNAFQTAIEAIQKAIGGVLSFAGSVLKSITKNTSGALTPSAVLSKYTRKLPSGTLTLQGSVQKAVSKAIGGVLTFIGELLRLGRRLKMWLFQRPYLNMVVETKTYRDVSTETREVKP